MGKSQILQAWNGAPRVWGNSTITGAAKRKTDIPGANLPVLQDLTSILAESCIPARSVQEDHLRLADSLNERKTSVTSSLVNDALLRFRFILHSFCF